MYIMINIRYYILQKKLMVLTNKYTFFNKVNFTLYHFSNLIKFYFKHINICGLVLININITLSIQCCNNF